ncbi:hypothetical protein [Paenibacillus pini]|uniref:Uncharacterized protein n=1 Tax=Paenibacillus pini JCM 16418 TaxID=1236976 RepID=W7YQ29_9BACL|nr:hypothetical protein [Paenibacillus pini]GAF09593.1 hypothetical protein JCM16418_3739 [Paenibacillus pini JCM 16418]
MDRTWAFDFEADGKKLVLGQHVIKGGRYGVKEGYLRFESPEWFKVWTGVPMKLVFSDQRPPY